MAVVCGGPSGERGISLNSARTVLDHLGVCEDVNLQFFYVNRAKRVRRIESRLLYSNTPEDFDFKLHKTSSCSLEEFGKNLDVDVVWSLLHGVVGEDGQILRFLEKLNIPFVGMSADACERIFEKSSVSSQLKSYGFNTLEYARFAKGEPNIAERVQAFCDHHKGGGFVVKPDDGGSSLGVAAANTVDECVRCISAIHENVSMGAALLEPRVRGREFSLVILQDDDGEPIPLIPVEIEHKDGDGLYTYRKKYLPTNATTLRCPASFSEEITEMLRTQGADIFRRFNCRDIVRFDGWVLEDGSCMWTDLNAATGLEQNSFVFLQSLRVGLTHQGVLRYVLNSALQRVGKSLKKCAPRNLMNERQAVAVLCGGDSLERQVSLMSGLNVWLKLRSSETYEPFLYLLDHGEVWSVPYAFALFHTVEEVVDQCRNAESIVRQMSVFQKVRSVLGCQGHEMEVPVRLSLSRWLSEMAEDKKFVFLALHGGCGENGEIQAMLEAQNIPFNGSTSEACALMMDKAATGQRINLAKIDGVRALPKHYVQEGSVKEFFAENQWDFLTQHLECDALIVKPNADGCSSGVIKLTSAQDLEKYGQFLLCSESTVPPATFDGQLEIVEIPNASVDLIFEPFVQCDKLYVCDHEVMLEQVSGWVELTVGVYEREGEVRVMSPSVTVTKGAILSLEEKFQGGTGINLTPPPAHIISPDQWAIIQRNVEKIARCLGVRHYARLDIFFSRLTQEIILIEGNALPGLTPSTVLYHQALSESSPMTPREFLESIIDTALEQH